MEKDKAFDAWMRDNLDKLKGNDFQSKWDAFEEKLDASLDTDSKDNIDHSFDDIIRDRINGISFHSSTNDWDIFEQKLDQSTGPEQQISDQEIDNLVRKSVEDTHIPFNEAHWAIMSKRLEEEFSIKKKIIRYKVIECVLMLLILLTIGQYLPLNKKQSISPINQNTTDNNGLFIQNLVADNSFASRIIEANTSIYSQKNDEDGKLTAAPREIKPLDYKPSDNDIVLPPSQAPIILSKNSAEEAIHNKIVNTKKASENIDYKTTKVDISSANNILVEPLPLRQEKLPSKQQYITFFKKFKKKAVLHIGAVTGYNYNHIIALSQNTHGNRNHTNQYRSGYSSGIVFHVDYERATLSSGLVYRHMSYQPQKTVTINGSFAEGYRSHTLDQININMLELPLNFQCRVNKADTKWKLYTITGASLNLMSVTNYNISIENLSNTTSIAAVNLGNEPNNSAATQELYTESRRSGTGFFEGGSFKDNSYFTANIGMGIERSISPRWTFFINPSYQYELFGKRLGLKKNRFHTFSAQIGVKARFQQ